MDRPLRIRTAHEAVDKGWIVSDSPTKPLKTQRVLYSGGKEYYWYWYEGGAMR